MIASLIKGSYTESCHKKNSGNGAGGKVLQVYLIIYGNFKIKIFPECFGN